MRGERPRGSGGLRAWQPQRRAENAAERLDGDRSGAKQRRFARTEVDDGGFNAVPARASVEHLRDRVSKLAGDMTRIRCADAAKTVGGWGGDAVTAEIQQSRQQRLCDRMTGNAQSYAVLTAGDDVQHRRGTRQYQGQWPRPKRLRQGFRAGAD